MDEMLVSAQLKQHGFNNTIINGRNQIFNNGHIAITKDLIFGLSVWNGEQWVALTEATKSELTHIVLCINKGNLPFPWHDDLTLVVQSKEK